MTGTASEFNEAHENSAEDLHKINLLSAWIFGRINTDCTLEDIDSTGCKLLIPRNNHAPAGIFRLIIMCPDNDEKVHTVIDAQPCRQLDESHETYTKISVRFIGMNNELSQEIKLLQASLTMSLQQEIKCSWMQS